MANWKRKFYDAIALVKAREGDDAATKLVIEIERAHVIQPSKTTSTTDTTEEEEEDDATYEDGASYGSYSPPPTSQRVPDKIESSSVKIGSSSDGLSNIVSPAYESNNNFLEAYSFDTMNNDEEMYFPILDDDNDNNDEHYYKEFKTLSRIKEDNNTNSKKMKNKRHFSELITTSAEGRNFVRLLRNIVR